MRGTLPGQPTAVPLGGLLPAVFQEDDWLLRFTGAIDELLAPAITALDCLPAYLDPALAPADFLPWLAGWAGTELDETWPLERQRTAIALAASLHPIRGTVEGLQRQLELATGAAVEVTDSGGVRWSREPLNEEPAAPPSVRVVVRGTRLSASTVHALVEAAKPAHVRHEIQVIGHPNDE